MTDPVPAAAMNVAVRAGPDAPGEGDRRSIALCDGQHKEIKIW